MQIIKDREIIEETCLHLEDEAEIIAGRFTVSLARWQQDRDSLLNHEAGVGVRLMGDDMLEGIVDDLAHLSLIVLVFPAFTDGRCYSIARLLRDRYGYKGEIRAQGDILHDQLFYMTQCGINSFEMLNQHRLVDAMEAFDDFSDTYQTTVLKPDPLYRRNR